MLRISLIQPDSRGSKEEVLNRALKLIKEAASYGVELACLPEHWIISYNFYPILEELRKEARRSGIGIITGGNYIENGDNIEIGSFLIDENGEIIGEQKKVHLFGAENEVAKAGSSYEVFRFKDIKIGISICHDLVYPEVIRILTLKGAEIIFAPARIKKQGFDPWKLYVMTRALENRVHIASSLALIPPNFLGNSFVVDFQIEEDVVIPFIASAAKDEEGFAIYDVDPKAIEDHRKARLGARRVSTYGPLLG
ncbi:MAG TPA: carbon-nitrogen hydrolase family protein [Geobacterales bacterium]|nr:carbon-nitrogen hydrolase family protein [Geobacterales bacterium]